MWYSPATSLSREGRAHDYAIASHEFGAVARRSFYLYQAAFCPVVGISALAMLAILAFQLTEVLVLPTEEGVGHIWSGAIGTLLVSLGVGRHFARREP